MISFPLETIQPFKFFSPELLQFFKETGTFQWIPAKQEIFQADDPADYAYLLISGRVAMQKSSANGKTLIVELIFPNEMFGIVGLMEHKAYPLSAEAKTESGILKWGSAAVREKLLRSSELTRFSEIIFQRLRHTQELARAIAHDDVETRVGAVVSALFHRIGEGDVLRVSRLEIAELAGITPETASRVIKNFEKEKQLDASSYGSLILPEGSSLRTRS